MPQQKYKWSMVLESILIKKYKLYSVTVLESISLIEYRSWLLHSFTTNSDVLYYVH